MICFSILQLDTSGSCETKYHKDGATLTKSKSKCVPLDRSGHCANVMEVSISYWFDTKIVFLFFSFFYLKK